MSNAVQTLTTINEGRTINDLAAALNTACTAVKAHGKPATITLTITVDTFKKGANLIDQPITMAAEVRTKLPREDLPVTLFFVDDNGDPTRTPNNRQSQIPGLGLVNTATGEIKNG